MLIEGDGTHIYHLISTNKRREKSTLGRRKNKPIIIYHLEMHSYIIAIEFIKKSFCSIPESPNFVLILIERSFHDIVTIVHRQGKAIESPYSIGMNKALRIERVVDGRLCDRRIVFVLICLRKHITKANSLGYSPFLGFFSL